MCTDELVDAVASFSELRQAETVALRRPSGSDVTSCLQLLELEAMTALDCFPRCEQCRPSGCVNVHLTGVQATLALLNCVALLIRPILPYI